MSVKAKEDGWLLVRKDGKTQTIIPGMMFVGREECDIILQSASSDKRHAVIFFDSRNRELHIKDLNSLTGTYVNGMRIPEQTYVTLKLLDNLRFGYGPDIFFIQHIKGVSPTSPSTKTPDKNIKSAVIGKVAASRSNSVSPVVPKEEPIIIPDTKRRNQLNDSLENLNSGDQNAAGGDARSLETEDSNRKSVSPGFSSLTFKRSNTRVLNSPSQLVPSSVPVLKETDGGSEKSSSEVPSSPSAISNKNSQLSRPSSVEKEAAPVKSEPENSPTESGPSAMAFTVDFDTPIPSKKFNIRDSISKYAPRKAEIERMHRQKEKSVEPIIKKSVEPETAKTPPVELRKKRSTQQEKVATTDNAWILNPQFQRQSAMPELKLSNGATYLIEKMFSDSKTEIPSASATKKTVPSAPSPKEKKRPSSKDDHPSNDEDCKSDTGTYTVDEELNDKVVKEARQKISEVFGVEQTNSNVPLKEIVVKEKVLELPTVVTCASAISSNAWITPSPPKDEPIIPPVRPKRRLPTPPGQQQPTELVSPSSEGRSHSSHENYSSKTHSQPFYSTFPKDLKRNTIAASAALKEVSLTLPNRRLTGNNLELLQSSYSSENTSPVFNGHAETLSNRTSPVRTNWRRSPWHLSGSDMDLDHMRAETSSVLSDASASTEPPSINVKPGSPGANVGPQMKFNRAFALRRARLGLETELPPPSKSLVLRDSKPPPLKESPRPSTLTPFSRQDGGRFSLRLPKSASKITPAAKNTRAPAVKPPATLGPKLGHRRMESDPTKINVVRKSSDSKAPMQVAKTKPSSSRPSFQRASSFTNNEDEMFSSDNDLRKSYGWKQADRQSAAHLRSVPRIPQVTSRKDNNEEDLFGRENSASPKFIERNELSALDNLVIQATNQLSAKLKAAAYRLLIKERDKFTEDSSERLMINEVLPSVMETENTCSTCSERGVSQDLASTLKNLKRVEQSLKVLTIVIDEERLDHRRIHCHNNVSEDKLYVVDV